MRKDIQRHAERSLPNGETLYFVRPIGCGWRLDRHETHSLIRLTVDGLLLQGSESFLEEWREKDFNSIDDALAFFEDNVLVG